MAKPDQLTKAAAGSQEPAAFHPNIPVVAPETFDVSADRRNNAPLDEEFNRGLYVRESDGETYALAIHPPDTYSRTCSMKNSVHFWQGVETEVKLQFTKK